MAVDIDNVMQYLNAEDEEKPMILIALGNAEAWANEFLNRKDEYNNAIESRSDEDKIRDQLVMEMTVNMYLHRDGSAGAANKNYSGFNYLADVIRQPTISFSGQEEDGGDN